MGVNSAAWSRIEPLPPTFVVRIENVTVDEPRKATNPPPACVRLVGDESEIDASAPMLTVTEVVAVRVTARQVQAGDSSNERAAARRQARRAEIPPPRFRFIDIPFR